MTKLPDKRTKTWEGVTFELEETIAMAGSLSKREPKAKRSRQGRRNFGAYFGIVFPFFSTTKGHLLKQTKVLPKPKFC